MSEFKGTPGPWAYWDTGECRGVGKAYDNEADLFHNVRESKRTDEQDRANALLVSASPELFKAVNDFLNHFEGGIPLWLFEEAESAIAKAVGRSEGRSELVYLCSVCKGYGKYQDGDSGTAEDGFCPNIVDCECDDSERFAEPPQ